jgi:hypothetical protein
MNSVRAIMGATQVGGRNKKRNYGGNKSAFYGFDCRCSDQQMKPQNISSDPELRRKNKLERRSRYGDEMDNSDRFQSFLNGAKTQSVASATGQSKGSRFGILGEGQVGQHAMPNGFPNGGARKATSSRKANAEKYRKFLDGLDVKRLQKIAKTKGIKITKKKDGKTVYCKKATIVSKLFKFKYGK